MCKARVFLPICAMLLSAMAMGVGDSSWVGKWNVTDTNEQAYVIALMDDGTAQAQGSQNTTGKWYEKDGKAYITWSTGWSAILWDDAGTIQKDAFLPSENFDGMMKMRSQAIRR